ncbi:MAG: polyprenol monophosphomannose synthase [Thermoproteota archaeon]|nr:polyprenol monophosphomannose synthase [Thermoproteota archaeon]
MSYPKIFGEKKKFTQQAAEEERIEPPATVNSSSPNRINGLVWDKFQAEPLVAVILPTFCEAENIGHLIEEIQALRLNLLVAVIDDLSPDGTANIVRRLQRKYNNILLFVRPAKLGLGTAITAGFQWMLRLLHSPNYVITMDADYSHNPQDIPKLVRAAEKGYDLVIGSRYCSGGKIVGWSHVRWLISKIANLIASTIVGIQIRDCTSGFRCYSMSYIRSALPSLHSQTYEVQIETVRQAWSKRFHVKEIPITFANRKHGKSKLTKREFQSFLSYIIKTILCG